MLIGDKVTFIHHCPECRTALMRPEGEAAHYCPNERTCPPLADTKSNQAGRINPRNITIDDVQADYDAVSRVYQKGTSG